MKNDMRSISLKNRMIIGVILNFIIFAVTILAMIWQIGFRGSNGPLGDFGSGFASLITFTNESNILCAMIALIMACIGIHKIKHKEYDFSHSLRAIQLIGATVVFLTFVVVATFLTPMFALKTGEPLALFANSMFFTHFFTPIIAGITFVFFTPSKAQMTIADNFLALIPIVLYGIVYFINVIIFQNWPDFYNFTLGGKTQFIPLVFIVIFAVSFGLARSLIIAQKKVSK